MPSIPSPGFPQDGSNRTRAAVRAELADYIGGGNKDDIKIKADRCWDAAVRYFNRYAWKFNRKVQDILIDSKMKDNQTAPTISRDAGSGIGFTLDSGKKMTYWIEERVKDGAKILRRNDETGAKVVVLTGDGTNDKPVITRPSPANPDATHWALFATATDETWPSGAEIAEVPIATTTIEDTRVGTNPPIPSRQNPLGSNGHIYQDGSYDLDSTVRSPRKCFLIDAQGRERRSLVYVDYATYAIMLSRAATVSVPGFYTIRNRYREGQLILHPRPNAIQQWPGLRFVYDGYIMPAGGEEDSTLDVPMEVDEAIFQKAVAYAIDRHLRDADASQRQHAMADELRMALELEHRDFEDS